MAEGLVSTPGHYGRKHPAKKRITVDDLDKLDELTINIICLNKIHKVTLRKRGSITLHNHDHRKEIQMQGLQKVLGAKPSKCLRVLLYWQDVFMSGGYSWHTNISKRSVPWTVCNMQRLARQAGSQRKCRIPYTGMLDAADESERWKWFKCKIAHGLVPRDMNVTDLSEGTMFRVRVNNVWSSWGLAGDSFPVREWLYRIVCSGLAEVDPHSFVPLGVRVGDQTMLHYLSRDNHKIERVDMDNGDCPTCLTSSESKAKYFTALHQYRALAVTLDRNDSHPHDGG